MSENRPTTKLVIALSIGLTAFGFAPILVRLAPETSPFLLAAYRTIISVVLLFPFWLYYRDRTKQKKIGQRKLNVLSAGAGIALGVHFICWIGSLKYTSVASASVLVTTHPMLLIIAERFLFNEKFSSKAWAGVVISLLGSIFLGWSDQQASEQFSDPLLGNTLAFTAAVIFMIYFLVGRKVRQELAWIDYTFRIYSMAAVTCFTVVAFYGFELPGMLQATGLWVGFGLAIGPQILGHGSMNYAVKYVSPTLLGTLILAEPLFASVIAYFWFGEIPPFTSVIAMLIILSGIMLTWRK